MGVPALGTLLPRRTEKATCAAAPEGPGGPGGPGRPTGPVHKII